MKTLHILALFFQAFIALSFVSVASAHRPDWGEQGTITEVSDIKTSRAFYRQLNSDMQVDFYSFSVGADRNLHAGINIPAIAGLENYQVSLALFGPGLSGDNYEVLPPLHPEGLGAMVYPSSIGEDFFEPFTQTHYWGRQQVDINLPEPGKYYLAVWQPNGNSGKYVLDIGTEEVFGIGDILNFPIWWVKVHLFFEHGVMLGLIAGAFVVSLGLLIFLPRRLRKASVLS